MDAATFLESDIAAPAVKAWEGRVKEAECEAQLISRKRHPLKAEAPESPEYNSAMLL
jgi:hypothetical protein